MKINSYLPTEIIWKKGIQDSLKEHCHCVKSVRIQSYSGSPLFSRIQTKYGAILRMSPYSVRMQENGEKMRTRIIPNTETFSAVCETL